MNPVSLNSHTHAHVSALFSFPPSPRSPPLFAFAPPQGRARSGPQRGSHGTLRRLPAPGSPTAAPQSWAAAANPSPLGCGVWQPESACPASALPVSVNWGVWEKDSGCWAGVRAPSAASPGLAVVFGLANGSLDRRLHPSG